MLQGTEIQGTFWREAADRWADNLREGGVYYISRFDIKVADKTYSKASGGLCCHCIVHPLLPFWELRVVRCRKQILAGVARVHS